MKHISKKLIFKIIIVIAICLLLSFLLFSQMKLRENMTTSELQSLTNPSKGFCETYRGKSHELEAQCNKLTNDRCKTMDCCVLANNSKCVAGSIHGTTFKTEQNGNTINIDTYHHNKKCYGKCT